MRTKVPNIVTILIAKEETLSTCDCYCGSMKKMIANALSVQSNKSVCNCSKEFM